MKLSQKHEVESTAIGQYENTGKLHLRYNGKTCACLDLNFFTEEFPKWEFNAHWSSPRQRGLIEPVISEPRDYGGLIKSLLASPNLSSREWIQRQYDHEVQGGSAIKFLVGRDRKVPNDAAVIRPILTSRRGLAVSQALNPSYSVIDTYHMVTATIDEAVRRLLAVGGKLGEIGGVDNFCWPTIIHDPEQNPDGHYKAAQLVRANWALRDLCLAYSIPLLSGKDSMYVDGHLPGKYGERHKVSGLPTMQFTATTIVPDIHMCLTMEPKTAGDRVYLLGVTRNELGGSEFYEHFGYTGLNVPQLKPKETRPLYRALESAIAEGLPASCHGIYRGGLGIHAAMAAFAGKLGMNLDLSAMDVDGQCNDYEVLFSETCGRFLVTVPADRQRVFESIFSGLSCKEIGEVTSEARFSIRGRRFAGMLVDESLAALEASWECGRGACE
jgi:phosphoribosylformylglycinamidine synthase